MPRDRVIVLKLGGSVLTDDASLALAVHEIHRWRRERWGVVAVVSALAGVTDHLLDRCRAGGAEPEPHTLAAALAGGEWDAATRLALRLDASGVPAAVFPPAALALLATGDALDAEPVSVDVAPLADALAADTVAVVPGFVAHEPRGRTVTLGRGGSDLTALVLAHALNARVRLVKDVDGLYERDPAAPGPRPRRWRTAHWDQALATDGSIVQWKAVRWARAHGVEFELGALQRDAATRVGALETREATPHAPRPPLRVALLGAGTVGGGVLARLLALQAPFTLVAVARRRLDAPVPAGLPGRRFQSLDQALERDADVVVELIGGVDDAHRAVARALEAGRHVVTANKALLAAHGAALRRLAAAHGVRLLDSAAVGGAMPVLERLRDVERGEVRRIRAVLNGTTNWVLERVQRGAPWDAAVAAAVAAGLAERDPARDLSGRDAADKLCVIAERLGLDLEPGSVHCEPVSAEALRAHRGAGVLRHVAELDVEPGRVAARVRLEILDEADPLAALGGEWNGVALEGRSGWRAFWRGRGAGRGPTTEAVMGDLFELWRDGAGRVAADLAAAVS